MKNKLPDLCLLAFFLAFSAVHAVEPTHANLWHSKEYDRSILELWTVDAENPPPQEVYFDGGGFKVGDKAGFGRSQMLRKYHSKPVNVQYAFSNNPSYANFYNKDGLPGLTFTTVKWER